MIAATERSHLGQSFFLGSAEMLRDRLVNILTSGDHGHIVIHANLHTIYSKSMSPSLRALLDDFPDKVVFFEGIALKLSRFACSGEIWPDVNGTDLIPTVLERAPDGTRVAIIGGYPDVNELACRKLGVRYRNLDIVSRLDGYDGLRHLEAHIEHLKAERPDIVLVGLGV